MGMLPEDLAFQGVRVTTRHLNYTWWLAADEAGYNRKTFDMFLALQVWNVYTSFKDTLDELGIKDAKDIKDLPILAKVIEKHMWKLNLGFQYNTLLATDDVLIGEITFCPGLVYGYHPIDYWLDVAEKYNWVGPIGTPIYLEH